MRIAFAGTAPFAEPVLAGLVDTGHRPVVVVTNPDRPKGRHGTPVAPPIKLQAERHGLPVLQPERISAEENVTRLLAYEPQVFVVCAYGQILRQNVLDAVLTMVVHPSLVPRWRGAAPVERALMAGETELGVTTLRMTAGVDEGPIGATRRVHVPADADAGDAYELLAPAAVDGVVAILEAVDDGNVEWREQVGEPTFAHKIGPDDRRIDQSRPAKAIVDQIRALAPHIGAVTELLGRRTLLWRAALGVGPMPDPRGGRLGLPAGDGWVEVLELQQEGRNRMAAAEFLRGAGRALARP
jgi:methionyl-tRNA formyltransferase